MNSGFAREFTDVKQPGGNNRPVLYKKDIVGKLRKQVLLACNKDVMFWPVK